MKKIKRTITIRRVEISSGEEHQHEFSIEKCPLCHSPLSLNESNKEIPKKMLKKIGVNETEKEIE